MAWKVWIKKSYTLALALSIPLSLGACSLSSKTKIDQDYIVLVPEGIEYNTMLEHQIFDISVSLEQGIKNKQDRARAFYDLGLLYERLGLYMTARSMFVNALEQDPSFSKPYNFMAISLAQEGKLSDAMDAYDIAIELAHDQDVYLYFARALSLYYAKRYGMAYLDIKRFYEDDKSSAHRIMWLYLIEKKYKGQDIALLNLAQNLSIEPSIDDEYELYLRDILRIYQGLYSEKEFFSSLQNASIDPRIKQEILCEAYFYLGLMHKDQGQLQLSLDYFSLCLQTKIYGYVEFRYAETEVMHVQQLLQHEQRDHSE